MDKKKLNKQQKAYKAKGLSRADLQRALKLVVGEELDKLKKRHPDSFKELDAILNIKIIKRTPKGKGKTKPILAIVDALINDKTAQRKQVDILQQVQQKFRDIPLLDNIWRNELHPKVLQQIQEKINNNMDNPVSVRGCKNLKEIRKVIYATRKIKGARRTYTKDIALSNEEIVIGKTVYRVEMRNKGKPSERKAIRIKMKDGTRQWINFAPLVRFLVEQG